jgi:hypothetical protein
MCLKILKAQCMFFFQTFVTNLVLTKSSGPKRHAVAFNASILPVSVCITQISVGGGGRWDRLHQQSECRSLQKYGRLFGDCRPQRPLSIFYLR